MCPFLAFWTLCLFFVDLWPWNHLEVVEVPSLREAQSMPKAQGYLRLHFQGLS